MNVELYEVSTEKNVLGCDIFEFSDDFFLYLAKSDFSNIRSAKAEKITIDDEPIELKLVYLSSFIRKVLIDFLQGELVNIVEECMSNLGDSPSKSEFKEYTEDLKELVRFIKALNLSKYSYLKRV